MILSTSTLPVDMFLEITRNFSSFSIFSSPSNKRRDAGYFHVVQLVGDAGNETGNNGGKHDEVRGAVCRRGVACHGAVSSHSLFPIMTDPAGESAS
jgi:hypothetical protein